MPAARALALALVAAALAGCIIDTPRGVPDGSHRERPVRDAGSISLDLKQMEMTWSDGVGTRAEVWDVTRGHLGNGIVTLETERMTLRFRIDEPVPVGLVYDEDLSRENSFNLSYRESADYANRTITRVASFDAESRLEVTTLEPMAQDVAGFVKFTFLGACDAADAGCDDPGKTHPVTLEGKFPKRRH